ncbi:hypothetical protein [Massilia sp. TWP1-3-3]|uniref:hypothetical protein n=1 Tax=Massilia sp. TWP1-3-3 TaxID=2804573 RepID=UPI003CEB2BC8
MNRAQFITAMLILVAACYGTLYLCTNDTPAAAATVTVSPDYPGTPLSSPFSTSAAARQWTLAAPPQSKAQRRYVGRNGRQIALNGLSVAQWLALHASAARVGNGEAAYAVYQALSICANLEEPVADYADQSERKIDMLERDAIKTVCTNISPAEVQERMRFLSIAATAGKSDAQIDFYMDRPGPGQTPEGDADDPARSQWKAEALAHLLRAAQQCDHFALSLLSTAYDAGQLGERNVKLAIAYSAANGLAAKHPRSMRQLRAQFDEEPSEADVAEGMQMGSRLAQQACHS